MKREDFVCPACGRHYTVLSDPSPEDEKRIAATIASVEPLSEEDMVKARAAAQRFLDAPQKPPCAACGGTTLGDMVVTT